MEELRFSSTQS